MDYTEKLLLRKRAVIESVNDFLKNICQIEHSLPDMKSAVRFIEKQLLESGIELDSSAAAAFAQHYFSLYK